MKINNDMEQTARFYKFFLIAGIIAISFNLRPAITSVGPLLGIIRDEVGLSNGAAGLLTSLPLIAFAVMSPFAAKLGNRYSYEGAMLLGLILLFIGMSIRPFSFTFLLFGGTFLAGIGIAILNVLLPGLIKDKFPLKVGLMTSIYSTTMGIVAATASGISIPIEERFEFGWQIALIIWVIPAILAIIMWSYLRAKAVKNTEEKEQIRYAPSTPKKGIWRSKLAWQMAMFMGLQSFLFYVTISWLPEILFDKGLSMETAGWMLSFTQIIGLPASFAVPVLADKMKSQKGIIMILAVLNIIGYIGILISNNFTIIVISSIFIGIPLSGIFALALTLLGKRARTSEDAADLSGMAQSVGYVLAAIGPIFIGFLFDLSGNWDIPIIAILITIVILTIFGLFVGRDRYVYDE
ncbi:CynX/NimT family MFS transporter [Oceanobacillus sp. CAU 1775]